MQVAGCRVQGAGCRVQGAGCVPSEHIRFVNQGLLLHDQLPHLPRPPPVRVSNPGSFLGGKRNGSRTCLVQPFGRAGTNIGRQFEGTVSVAVTSHAHPLSAFHTRVRFSICHRRASASLPFGPLMILLVDVAGVKSLRKCVHAAAPPTPAPCPHLENGNEHYYAIRSY